VRNLRILMSVSLDTLINLAEDLASSTKKRKGEGLCCFHIYIHAHAYAVTNYEMYRDFGILKFLEWEGLLAPCKDWIVV